MSDLDICHLTAAEALQRFRERTLSPVELLDAVIARAEATEPVINALNMRYFDEARAAAQRAAQAWRDGTARPLEGIPVAIKDEAMIAGRITTNGSLLLRDYVATDTDVSVERLLDAGAIVHARTTTPEFSMAFVTDSRLWGTTRNPWNPAITPGGSSGGAAASLAAGSTVLASASDIAGSIRVPAAMTGCVGFKPPFGRIPQSTPYNYDDYSQEGPLARSVEDCRLMQNVMAGPHPRDPLAIAPRMDIPARLPDIRGWRVGYSLDLGYQPISADIRRETLAALALFRSAGCEVVEMDPGWSARRTMKTALIHYASLMTAQMRRDYGSTQQLPQLTSYIRRFLDIGGDVSAADLLASIEQANHMYADLARIHGQCEVLVVPTVATTAIAADFDYSRDALEIDGKRVDPILGWVLTYPFNTLGRCPVLNLPVGMADNGVPVGVQIVGRPWDDVAVFAVAAAVEREAGGPFLSQRVPPS